MTREEAIKILKEIIEEGWLISDFEKCTAIDACEMAIKALEQEDIFGTPMKVREAIALLAYGAEYEIKGAYSGKIYHRSWKNKRDHAEQFYDETVVDNPFYTKIRVNSASGMGERANPVIGIWMHDYQMCKENEDGN